MDVIMPDGTTVYGVPDGTTKSQLMSRYSKYKPQQPVLSERDQTAQRIAQDVAEGRKGNIEGNLEIAAQLGLGPVADAITSALTPPKAYTAGVTRIIQALPDDAASGAIESGIKEAGDLYNKIPQRGRDIIEAAALPAALIPAGMAKGAYNTARRGAIASRRADAIISDVLPGVTKISPARDAASHSVEVPVMGGMWNKTIETPTAMEIASASEVGKIKGYNIKGSNLSKHNAVHKAIEEEAVSLRKSLKKEPFELLENVPERTPVRMDEFGDPVQGQTIPASVRNKFDPVLDEVQGGISSNATLSGDARAVADDVVSKTREIMAQQPPTLEGLLNVRQEVDKWARRSDAKFFDKTGARQYAIKEIRDAINTFIDQNAQGVAVKDSLKKQSSLYRAKDVLQEKAAEDIRGSAIDQAKPSTIKTRAKNAIKSGASYVGISK